MMARSFHHLGHDKEILFTVGRVAHQPVGDIAVADFVFPPPELLRHHRGHGRHALDLHFVQHLHPLEDAIKLACHGVEPLLGHFDAGQSGDASHGVLVNGHGVFRSVRKAGALLASGGQTDKMKAGKEKGLRMAVTELDRLVLEPGARLLGLDLGEKTIGLALSDRLLTVATPMETLKRGKFAQDAARLDIIISEQGVGGLVVGLPLNMDGSDGPSAQSARAFGRNWGGHSPIPLVLWDERLSTVAVTRTLLEADASRRRRNELVDRMAAAYILQGALDRLRYLRS